MILYFNSKIVKDNLTPDTKESGYFYPIIYPRNENIIYNKEEVLYKTIESYKTIEFSKVYINIEFEVTDYTKESILSSFINELWPKALKSIKFKRPSTVSGWIAETENLLLENNINEPVLVVMNHDHPFLEYNIRAFNDTVSNVFDNNDSVFKRILFYSHTSEYINWSLNDSLNVKYKNVGDYLYKSDNIDNWVDSIHIMTFETLLFIWKSLKFEGEYIGRFDWVGVKFSKLGLTAYAYPREFFRHFDGYFHVTGSRLSSNLNLTSDMPLLFPNKSDLNSIVNFYYQKWIDLYIFHIEFILKEKKNNSRIKSLYVEVIYKTLSIFKKTYINVDSKNGLVNNDQIEEIFYLLQNKIFYNANYIFQDLQTNSTLRENKIKKNILFKFKHLLKHVINKI